MTKKISRYKPLYKNFVRLRKNIQNRKKLLTNFEKKKWQNLINFLKISSQRRKKNFESYDQFSFYVFKYGNSLKKNFLNNLLTKQKLSLFYGRLQNKKIKKLILSAKSNKNKKLMPSELFINSLENRIDTILYRSHFVCSIREARLLIQHKHVFINSKVVTSSSLSLNRGDILTLSKKGSKIAKLNVFKSNLWPLPPEFLQINYKTFQISFLDNLYKPSLSILYPFWLNLNSVLNYYK